VEQGSVVEEVRSLCFSPVTGACCCCCCCEGSMRPATTVAWAGTRTAHPSVLTSAPARCREAGIRWTEGRQRASRTPHGEERTTSDGCAQEMRVTAVWRKYAVAVVLVVRCGRCD
jgi:hypothetical protein